MRLLNELAEYPLMKQLRGSDSTDDEQVHLLFVSLSRVPELQPLGGDKIEARYAS